MGSKKRVAHNIENVDVVKACEFAKKGSRIKRSGWAYWIYYDDGMNSFFDQDDNVHRLEIEDLITKDWIIEVK